MSDREKAEKFAAYLLGPEAFTVEGTSEELIMQRLKHLHDESQRTGKPVLQIIDEETTA